MEPEHVEFAFVTPPRAALIQRRRGSIFGDDHRRRKSACRRAGRAKHRASTATVAMHEATYYAGFRPARAFRFRPSAAGLAANARLFG